MSDVTRHPSWSGHARVLTVPTPSWMAPPLHEPFEGTSVRVPIPPSVGPPVCPVPQLPLDALNVQDAPPPSYPDLRMEHAALVAECTALRIQLKGLADAMGQLKARILEESEPELVRLACAIGERVAARTLSSDPTVVVGWAREAIAELGSEESVVVAVSPDIAHTLTDADWVPIRSASVRIETDPTLGAARCEVRATCSTVEVSLLARAKAVTREVVGDVGMVSSPGSAK
jgi:Flagellar assembly protein FliH